jgi:hypothetical protein
VTVKKRFPSLRHVLAYKNREIIARFCKDQGMRPREALLLFKDMLRYLWLAEKLKKLQARIPPSQCIRVSPAEIIDEMWHTFVLSSSEYAAFGRRYFGRVILHIPTPTVPAARRYVALQVMRDRIQAVRRLLGPRVAQRWFDDDPRRFSMVRIKEAQLKVAIAEERARAARRAARAARATASGIERSPQERARRR